MLIAPTLDLVADVVVNVNAGVQTIDLSGITAGENEIQPLRVTAFSDNPNLIPAPSLTYTSDDSNGSLSFAPAPDLGGTATITVTVEDGGVDGDLGTAEDNQSVSRSFNVAVFNSEWQQVGEDIDGEASGDRSGISVSMSNDGMRVAIGAPNNKDNGFNAGQGRIYQWNGASWTKIGQDIDGEAAGDISGEPLAISGDGFTVAIGAWLNDGNGASAGHARIFRFDGTSWQQLGGDIDGEAAGDESGVWVDISEDGDTVAIGARKNDGNGIDAGHVRVYRWNGSVWGQLGSDIEGESPGDWAGSNFSMSADGSIIAVGSPFNDAGGTDAGHVRVFNFDGTTWSQMGSSIVGDNPNDGSFATALSEDGFSLAVGSTSSDFNGTDSGDVRVYRWIDDQWMQLGAPIPGENAGDTVGGLQLSADGNSVIFGSALSDIGEPNSGATRVFQWGGVAWEKIGQSIYGVNANDKLGWSTDISSDGRQIVVGAPLNDRAVDDIVNFGSGANAFNMQFVEIGKSGNAADTTGIPNPVGDVSYEYQIGKFEVSREMITNYNDVFGKGNSLEITMKDMDPLHGGNDPAKPVTGITWNEAARFVNWLNTSQGHSAAYKFETTGINDNISLWGVGDIGYDASNPYRNSNAVYVLPTADEWYKAAYYDPASSTWRPYASVDGNVPSAVASGTGDNTAVYNQPQSTGPAIIDQAGGLNSFGIMGMSGNVWEWEETSYDLTNISGSLNRGLRGGSYNYDSPGVLSSSSRLGLFHGPTFESADVGFRVVRISPFAADAGNARIYSRGLLNKTPTIDPIENVTIDEDAGEQSIIVSGISAGENELQPVRVTALSDNVSLISDLRVSNISPNTSSLMFNPLADQSGVSTITVTVEDGGLDGDLATAGDNLSFSRTFDVTVNAVNDLPTLGGVSNQTADEDAAEQTVNLTGISAGGGESQPLRVTASSSDTTLIPNPVVQYPTPSWINNDLLAYYPFDGNADDASGNGRNGVANGATPTNDRLGVDNSAYQFDGVDDYIRYEGQTVTSNPFTWSVWFKLDSVLSTGTSVLIAQADDPGQNRISPVLKVANGVLAFSSFDISSGVNELADDEGSQLATDQWYHAVISSHADGKRDLYLDGDLAATGTWSSFGQVLDNTYFGVRGGLNLDQALLDGSLDEARIYSRALTPAEVLELYQSHPQQGKLSLQPNRDAFGTTTITVTVEDGGLDLDLATIADNATFTRTFEVTVNAVNDPPVLATLPETALDEDTVIHGAGTNLSLFASDIDSDVSKLEYRIVNLAEIDPQFGLSIGMDSQSDSFALRGDNTIHVHPAANFFESTQVVIEARDPEGDVSNQKTFNLVINAVNDPPVLDPASELSLSELIEDSGSPVGQVGTLVSTLIDENGPLNNYSDVDGVATGIAVAEVNGAIRRLWFSIDDGTTWQAAEGVSEISPLLLHADESTRVYLEPDDDVSGEIPHALTIKAWDRSDSNANGSILSEDISLDYIGEVATGAGSNGFWDAQLDAQSNILWVANYSHGVRSYNVETPGSFTPAGHYDTPNHAVDLVLVPDDDVLFVSDHNALVVLDVQNPADPQLLNRLPIPGLTQQLLLSADKATLYLASDGGVRVINVEDYAAPMLVHTLPLNGQNIDLAYVNENLIAASSRSGGISLLDVANPRMPTVLSSLADGFADAIHLVVDSSGQYAYVTDTPHGVKVIDISDPNTPSVTGQLTMTRENTTRIEFLNEDYFLVGSEQPGLDIGLDFVNASEPSSPTVAASFTFGDSNPGYYGSTGFEVDPQNHIVFATAYNALVAFRYSFTSDFTSLSAETDSVSLLIQQSPSVAVDDFYSPLFDGVETFVISKADLLANDTLGNGESINTVTITADAISTAGGTITVDGDEFTYTRQASWFSGIDTFGYTLDDGGSTSNATVTILSGLQGDTLTITLEPGRDHDVTLQYADDKLVLMDHVTQETLLNIPKELVPTNVDVIGAPANSNIVTFNELTGSEPSESSTSWSYQGGTVNDQLAVLGTGSQWAWLSSDPQVENDLTVDLKLLTTLIDSYTMIAVEKVSIGQVDRVEFSDPYLEVGTQTFDLSSTKPVNLPTDVTISEGILRSSMPIGPHVGESIVGSGQIDAVFAGGVGSLIRLTGDLAIGDANSPAGFRTDGFLEVGANTVTLLDTNQASLGELTTLGDGVSPGTLVSDHGLAISFTGNIEGYGAIQTDANGTVINNGNIIGTSSEQPITINSRVKGVGTFDNVVMNGEFTPGFSPALWTSGTVAYTDLNRFVIELGGRLAGAEFDRVEHYLAKLGGTLDVQLMDGFKPALGDLFEVITSEQPFEGQFSEILLPLQDNGVRIRELLGQHGIELETVFDVADTLEVLKSQAADYQIAGHDGSGLKVQGDRFRAFVTSLHQFVAEHPWHTEELELEAGKLVQIATDGVNRLIIEGSNWKNFVEPSDVNNDQNVTALDALTVINELGRRSHSDDLTSELNDAAILVTGEGHFYDQNGDGKCTALDALRVINDLARSSVSGEGEAVPADYLSGGSDAVWSQDMEYDEDQFESGFEETELIYSDADPEISHASDRPEDLVYASVGQESKEAVDSLLGDLEDWWK